MKGHDRADAGRDCTTKGHELESVESVTRRIYSSDLEMRVGLGVPVTGEMFGRGDSSMVL